MEQNKMQFSIGEVPKKNKQNKALVNDNVLFPKVCMHTLA